MEVVVTEARNREDEERSSEEKRQIIPFPVNFEKWKRMDCCVDWNALPEDLLARILSRLPFSSLVRSRGVCRKWRDLALSPAFTFSGNLASKCVPIYFYEGPLQVYNSKSNAWEKQSLEFLGVPSASLALLVSAGGLLCFKNKVSGDFVVCNPITKRWRLVQLPPGFDHGAIQSPQPGREWIVPEPDTSSKMILSQEDERVAEFFRSFGREGIVGLLTEKYERNYKLIVAGLRDGDSQHRPTLIFDSLTSSWTRGSEVPSGVRFWELGKPIYFKGTFYCVTWSKGFSPESCSLRRPWSVVKYSVKKDYWSEYHSNISSATIPQLVEFRERGYLVQKHIHDISTLLFGELEKPEREARLIEKCREAKIPTMGDWCIGQGDCLYFGGCGKEQHKHLGFSVLVHDLTRKTSVWNRLPRLFDHSSAKPRPSLTWLRTLEASMTAAV